MADGMEGYQPVRVTNSVQHSIVADTQAVTGLPLEFGHSHRAGIFFMATFSLQTYRNALLRPSFKDLGLSSASPWRLYTNKNPLATSVPQIANGDGYQSLSVEQTCVFSGNSLIYGKVGRFLGSFARNAMNDLLTGPQVAQIVGISYDTLDYWVKGGLVVPSAPATEPRKRSHYSFPDIVSIAAVKTLRDQGVSLQKLKKVQAELWQRIGISFEQGLRGGVIVADRRNVLAVLYTLDDAVQIMSLLKGGQMVLPLDDLVEEVKQRTERMFGEIKSTPQSALLEMKVQNER